MTLRALLATTRCAGLMLLCALPCHADGLLDGLRNAGRAVVQGVETNVQANIKGESTVIGYVPVMSPGIGYVTCFKDVPGSAFSSVPISALGQASGFPAMIVTRDQVVASGQCAELQKYGLLIPVQGAAGATLPATAPSTAAAAAATSGDPVADAARICQLGAADITMLRDLALRFVRFDRAADRIVMSELVDGVRAEVAMDDKRFAQRAGQASQDITKGGVACGRAYWDGQAIKAATDALAAAQ